VLDTQTCVQTLLDRQLAEGGWSFRSGVRQSAVEPTALVLLAFPAQLVRERTAAANLLLAIQNPDGSWPAFVGDDREGSGVTGLAAYVLRRYGRDGPAMDRAHRWLLRAHGWEAHWLWKWKFRTTDRHVRFDPDKFGWPWMPETVSWVIPTAYSLLALKSCPERSHQELAQSRIRRGVEMLYDRMCLGGGWNAGNGVVYGHSIAAHPDATALALLALKGEPTTRFISESLGWLEQRARTCFAPWSLAWTIIALRAFGRPVDQWTSRLLHTCEPGEIDDCAILALVSLALNPTSALNTLGAIL
jgi:Squalene-hopene cyclase N-terminal domain